MKQNIANITDHTWVSTNVYEDLPPFAIHAGHDSDGDPIYVGRAYHNGDMLPAKVIPNKKQAYVAWGGEEHNKHDVEILTGHHYGKLPFSRSHINIFPIHNKYLICHSYSVVAQQWWPRTSSCPARWTNQRWRAFVCGPRSLGW